MCRKIPEASSYKVRIIQEPPLQGLCEAALLEGRGLALEVRMPLIIVLCCFWPIESVHTHYSMLDGPEWRTIQPLPTACC